MDDINTLQRDLEALADAGYLETWIDPESKEQQFRMTEGGMYEVAAGQAIEGSPDLVRKYTDDDSEDALDRLVVIAKRSVGGKHDDHPREGFKFDDETLREWITIRLDPEGKNPEDLLDE